MLIGLPDLAKERKLSKILINRRLPNFYYSLFVFITGRHFTIVFTNLINSKLISELFSSDKTVFLLLLLFFCFFLFFFMSHQQSFSYVGTGLPVLNQY